MRQVSLALVLLLACGCGGDSPTGPTSNPVRISGRVSDYLTQSPAAGAVIRFTPFERQFARTSEATIGANGTYSMEVDITGDYEVRVDDRFVGYARVTGLGYQADFLLGSGTCIARYGIVSDASRMRPIAGATVSAGGGRATTDGNGWYRFDLGCPAVVFPGNTTFMTVSHANFASRMLGEGRGVVGVIRRDVALDRE